MNENTIILTSSIYLITYPLSLYYARYGRRYYGDPAGKGLEKGLLFLFLVLIFLIVAIALTVINYFLIRRVDASSCVMAVGFLPIVLSVIHIVYIKLFG